MSIFVIIVSSFRTIVIFKEVFVIVTISILFIFIFVIVIISKLISSLTSIVIIEQIRNLSILVHHILFVFIIQELILRM